MAHAAPTGVARPASLLAIHFLHFWGTAGEISVRDVATSRKRSSFGVAESGVIGLVSVAGFYNNVAPDGDGSVGL